MATTELTEEEKNIEVFKVKKLVKSLSNAKGNGTSMISLVIPPKDQISRVSKMLTEEFGKATNIKSRVNRLSVQSAITSTLQRLKLYHAVPPKGLVLFCGSTLLDDGKEKQITIDFEPFRPINTSMYLCDNKFHVEALSELLEDDHKFGFIVMDGSGCLFGTLQGNRKEIIQQFSVELPKKHGRGGQSAIRFARLRVEKRHNYLRKCAEMSTQIFITSDKPNVTGIVLAGSADFKTELGESDLFDPRLLKIVLCTVDVSYGGENGFNQAIELSAEHLEGAKFLEEKKLIGTFLDEISRDTGKYCFGVEDTFRTLDLGGVELLLVWENLDVTRYIFRNPTNGAVTTVMLNAAQKKQEKFFKDPATGVDLEIVETAPLVDWIAENYRRYGTRLEFVSDRSQEGSQFVKGFGGIGGVLRWAIDTAEFAPVDDAAVEEEFM